VAINIERVLIEFLLGIRRIEASAFFRGYFNKRLYYRVNNAYNINKTLIKNNISIIMIDSNTENEIYYLVLALLNNGFTKKYKLETPQIFR